MPVKIWEFWDHGSVVRGNTYKSKARVMSLIWASFSFLPLSTLLVSELETKWSYMSNFHVLAYFHLFVVWRLGIIARIYCNVIFLCWFFGSKFVKARQKMSWLKRYTLKKNQQLVFSSKIEMLSFGPILVLRLKKYFLGIKLFCLSRLKVKTFSTYLK